MLEQSQQYIAERFVVIISELKGHIAQLERQADSTFGGQSWAAFSEAGFDDALITNGKALIELGERLKSGALPPWKIDQDKAFKNSALSRLEK